VNIEREKRYKERNRVEEIYSIAIVAVVVAVDEYFLVVFSAPFSLLRFALRLRLDLRHSLPFSMAAKEKKEEQATTKGKRRTKGLYVVSRAGIWARAQAVWLKGVVLMGLN